MEIQVPWLAHVDGQAISGFNGDGIDIDSSQDVLIEHNYINCGDDHFTILSGVGDAGKAKRGRVKGRCGFCVRAL